MPIYRAKTKVFVGNSLREKGEEFEYNGDFCKHLEKVGGEECSLPATSSAPNFEEMTKAELEAYGRTIGIELDRRATKVSLIEKLEAASK